MDHGRTPTAPSTPVTASAPSFPLYSTKTETKQRRHSTPHLGDGSVLSHRLAILAPKGERGSGQNHSSLRLKSVSRPDGIFKEKLPPRSRTGCWTCRTRKVKCDEEHPRCGQCVRLQHQCDYSPRLSFRDDTPRIIERMHEVSTEGSVVWDPRSKITRETFELANDYPTNIETLPLFSELTNDEDREMKALTRLPGTFNLVCNPESFANGNEDIEEAIEGSPTPSSVPTVKEEEMSVEVNPSVHVTDSHAKTAPSTSSKTSIDPDIVILRRFEDPVTKRVPANSNSSQRKSSVVSSTIPMLSNLELVSSISPRYPSPNSILQKSITPNDTRYFQHYSDSISPKIFQVGGLGQAIVQELSTFEKESMAFPPLFNAMMALSALIVNQKEGNSTSLDASQHYQLVLSSLQMSLSSPTDLSSDGTLYTHFFLLLYEISAVEFGRESLWPQQLPQFKGILLARPKREEKELVNFVTWYLIILDVYSALSSAGDGELVEALVKGNRVPDIRSLFNTGLVGETTAELFPSSAFRDVEKEVFLHFLSLFQQLILSAHSLARLCRAIRNNTSALGNLVFSAGGISAGHLELSIHQSQIEQELESLRETWRKHEQELELLDPNQQNTASSRINAVYEQCEILYQTCVIFAQTSMWAGQRQTMNENAILEVSTAIQTILTLTQQQCQDRAKSSNLGLLVFPLFLTGSVSTSGSEKMWVLELFGLLESGSISRASFVVKDALQVIYQRQNEEMMSLGHNMGVDWQDVLKELGTQIVSFGF